MLPSTMEAEDVLQESFMDVYRMLHTYRYQSTPGAWIKRIIVNNCINKLRKKKIHFEEIEEGRHLVEKEVELKDNSIDVKAIKDALHNLSDGYRAVFSLYAIEGYDHQEIAEILNISVSTSKSQYSRARKKIKETILNN